MRLTRLLPLAGVLVAGAALVALGWRAKRQASQVTYARDIAPIVLGKCAPCHRPGEAGPFNLLTYEEVSRKGAQIRKVTGRRFMPPWKPTPGAVAFKGDRSLTPEQIDLIARWVEAGTPPGDPRDLPPPPTWPTGWQLGTPDVIVQLPEPYELSAEGKDVYRNFVIPSPVKGLHYVAAWEFRPGSRAIHHAILNVDRLGLARKRDAEDPAPGFGGMEVGNVQSADGFYLVWAPGSTPTPPDPARAWRVDEKTDLVLQLHMQPRGAASSIHPTIGLYFSDRPPTQQLFKIRVGDLPIDIAPGDAHYTMRDDYTLPADVDMLGLFPHAHYLARKMRSWAKLPDGTEKTLLSIDDWDFNWQDTYTYAAPIALPAGTVISMEFVYDNSADNVRNPSRPPKRVMTGESSLDEMGNITFQVLPHDARGLVRLRAGSYERLLQRDDSARNHYNLANALADDGRTDEAMARYASAIEKEPGLAPAHFNLANLEMAKGDIDRAIAEFRVALKYTPEAVGVHVNLGHALEAKGSLQDALAEYRQAIAVGPGEALGHAALAAALAKKGDRAEAVDQFRQALAIEPGNGRIRDALEALVGDAGTR
jgi:tetratricopeptide (TPR) repeat protein/mono/diheme cytochrome c family protein